MVELSMEKSMVRWLMAKVVVAKKEKDDNEKKKGVGTDFFKLWPIISPPLAMESTPIYRGWKRDMLSFMVPNLGP
jgi:hypothetical protein